MQCEEKKTKPESIRKSLAQQVEEQSALCDVIVKMGYWEKKFHHCVLVVSPFFDHVLKDNFLEKQTGKIEMTVGTPVTIEMAIMFLYGKKPKLTQENIEHMISLAEFLLIPTLKSACISWLKTTDITAENCMDILQLSSIYNFDVPTSEEYLLSHMLEMLPCAQMVNLSKDSVQYLLSDRKLSYVPMDDKVTFLMRWANSQPARRKSFLKELFEEIDFNEVSKTVLDELRADQKTSDEIDLEKIVTNVENETPTTLKVLVMKSENNNRTFWCLALENERWFQLTPETDQQERSYYYSDISGARDVSSEIFFMQRSYPQPNVLFLNLAEDVCKTYQLVHEDNGVVLREIDGIFIMGDICIAYVNERVEINKRTGHHTESNDHLGNLRLMSLLGAPLDQLLALRLMGGDNIRTRFTNIATLYIGYIKDEAIIRLSPLLTFKDDKIVNISINQMLTVAAIFGSRKMSLFDLMDYKIETMQLKTEYNDKLVQSNTGFIIHNNRRCISLTRVTGPSLSSKYLAKEFPLLVTGFNCNKYIFCGNTWYHYYRRNREEHFVLESASHTEMMSKSSIEDVIWKTLPLPVDDTKCYNSTIKDNIFQINLPKNKLRCAIECPHCKQNTVRRTFVSEYDVGDSSYDDSSDDDLYGPVYYDYDSDYGYCFDSD